MGATTSVPADRLTVTPGDEARTEITVRNSGRVVDAYRFEPLGPLAPWMRLEPESLALMPDGEDTVTVTFAPPRTAQLTAGELAWAVRVVPREDAEGATVEEGVLEVAPFSEVAAELRPRTSRARGRRSGKHELAVDNLGNTPVEVYLAGGDAEHALDVLLVPDHLVLEPGSAAVVAVRPRARERFWRGQPVTHPFQVVTEPGGQPPIVVDGALLQEPVLPAWLLKALLLAAILAALALALWLAVLKPSIEDTARAIATEEAEAATADEAAAREASDAAAADDAAAAQEETDAQLGALDDALGKPLKKAPVTDPLGVPVTHRLATTPDEQAPVVVLDTKRTVSVTDLLLQNPAGDSGTVTVLRGDEVVYEARLENFRDLDLHLVAPIVVDKGTELGLSVGCTNPDPAGKAKAADCTPGPDRPGLRPEDAVRRLLAVLAAGALASAAAASTMATPATGATSLPFVLAQPVCTDGTPTTGDLRGGSLNAGQQYRVIVDGSGQQLATGLTDGVGSFVAQAVTLPAAAGPIRAAPAGGRDRDRLGPGGDPDGRALHHRCRPRHGRPAGPPAGGACHRDRLASVADRPVRRGRGARPQRRRARDGRHRLRRLDPGPAVRQGAPERADAPAGARVLDGQPADRVRTGSAVPVPARDHNCRRRLVPDTYAHS